eukprot:gnl/MRDRNA2_/MRDRNA2_149733_c0_seq1.p1 gnl/MRDRNA2_/MRDRNA2_149733_c0~~gnl/MRDRNA2_/MRDRNA2_149733_c0_seq1.p1  ORF type:complete len:149 (-),score=21.72 gnl/MRDRNA2_/MRDRNA2_149733_c0_seq1:130-576(-)
MASNGGAAGTPDTLGNAQAQIDRTMAAMRDNMAMLQEREGSLSAIQDKSSVLQGTSGAFNRQAKQLQLEMKWRQYKIAIFSVVIVIWIACFFIFKEHWKMYLPISAGVLLVVYLLYRCFARRFLQPDHHVYLEDTSKSSSMFSGRPQE